MSDLQQDQQGLRDRLQKLQQELAKRGMEPEGQKGQKASMASRARGEDGDQQGDGETATASAMPIRHGRR